MKVASLFKEYIWLVNTIYKARAISFSDLNERWVQTEMSGGIEMARATFNRHKDAIEDIFGIFIDCDRQNGYKYSIGNRYALREDSIQNWMLSTLSVNNILRESLSLQDRILLETVSSGGEYLPLMIEAMKNSVRVKMTYQRYGAETSKDFDIEPYCIKLFEKRWYVLGHFFREATKKEDSNGYFGIFSFDRIRKLELTSMKFNIAPDFDAAEYFSEYFGVYLHGNTALQRVVIRAFGQQRYYLRDLPVHISQQEIRKGKDYSDFEYHLHPTDDFKSRLLSLGSQIKVVTPQWLADQVCDMHLDAARLYKSSLEEKNAE